MEHLNLILKDAYVREDGNITSRKSIILNPLPQSANSKKLDPVPLFSLPIIDFGWHASQERIPANFAPPQGPLPVWTVMKTLQLFEIPEFSAQTLAVSNSGENRKQHRLDLAFAGLSRDQNDNPTNQILSSPDSHQEEQCSCVSTEKDELEKHIAKMRTEGRHPFPIEIRQEDVEGAAAAADGNDDDDDDDDNESPPSEEGSEDNNDEGNSDGEDNDEPGDDNDDEEGKEEEEIVQDVAIVLLDSLEAAAILLKMVENLLRPSPRRQNQAGLPPLPLRRSLSIVPPLPAPLRRISPSLAPFLFFRAVGRFALVNLLYLGLEPRPDPPGGFRPAQGSGGGTESPPPPPESSSAGGNGESGGHEDLN